MKKTAIDKSTVLPNLLIIAPAIALLIISTFTRTVWERTSVWTFVLTLLAAVPFLIPSTSTGKSVLATLLRFIPLAILAMFLITIKYPTDFLSGGSSLPLFGFSIALLTFVGNRKPFVWIPVVMLFTALFSYLLYQQTKSSFFVFIHVITATIVLSAAGATGWFGNEWKWLHAGVSLSIPLSISIFLSSIPYTDYLADLAVPTFPTIYLDGYHVDYISDHLSQMSFLGRTYLLEPDSLLMNDFNVYDSRILVILGHHIGWISYVLVGSLIVSLTIGLILSFKHRKGLGRLFPLAAIGTVVLPTAMLFLTNLGVFDAHTLNVPLFTGSFATNLFSIILLRLSLTYQTDPECYLAPEKEDYLFDLSLFDEDDKEQSDSFEGIGELRAFTLPPNEYIDTIVEAFSKQQIVIPFKQDLSVALTDRKLLFSRYSGDLSDAVNIFSLLKLVGDEHYMLISVAEDSNTSQLFLGVERITEALSNQEKVDYCVCLDENVPTNRFVIQILSCTEA